MNLAHLVNTFSSKKYIVPFFFYSYMFSLPSPSLSFFFLSFSLQAIFLSLLSSSIFSPNSFEVVQKFSSPLKKFQIPLQIGFKIFEPLRMSLGGKKKKVKKVIEIACKEKKKEIRETKEAKRTCVNKG